ncbi:unnamed protein product [[Candida] boidinii]|nr:unnamed protein product [[Candida] boidinii]
MNNLTAVINKQQLTTDTSASSTSHHNLQPSKSLNMLPMTSISSPAPNGNTLDKDQVKGTNEPINGKTGETYDPELQGEKDEKDEKDEPVIVDEDWIKCVLRRQLNETETSFKGTIFIDNLPQNTHDESDSEFYNSEVELDDDNGNDNNNKDITSNDNKGQPNEENIEEGEHSIANSENYEGAAVTQNNIHINGMDADVEIDDNGEFKPKDIHDQFDYYEHDDLLGDSGGLNLFDEPEIHTDNNLNMFG